MHGALALLVAILLTSFSVPLAAQNAPAPSEEIRAIQRELRALGYVDTPETGVLDKLTRYQVWFFADEHALDKSRLFDKFDAPKMLERLRRAGEHRLQESTRASVVVPRLHPKGASLGFALSDDGKWGASFSETLLKIWDMQSGLAVRDLEFGCCTEAAVFLPGSAKLAVGTAGPSIRIVDLASGVVDHRTVIEGQFDLDRNVKLMRVRKGTSELVVGDRTGHVFIYDWQQAKEIAVLGRHPVASNMFSNSIEILAVSPDGRLAASVRDEEKRIIVWDLVARKQLKSISYPGVEEFGSQLVFNDDGSKLFHWETYEAKAAEIDIKSGKSRPVKLEGGLKAYNPQSSGLNAVAEVPGSIAKSLGMFDVTTAKFEPKIRLEGKFEVAAWSSDGKALVESEGGTVKVVDLNDTSSWAVVADLRGATNVVTCGPGRQVAQLSGDTKVAFWDMASGIPLRDLDVQSNVKLAMCGKEGTRLFVGHDDGEVTQWSLAGSSPDKISSIAALPTEAYDKMLGLALSPDESVVAVSRGNGMVEPKDSPGTARKNRSEILLFGVADGRLRTRIPFEKLTTEQTWAEHGTSVVMHSSRYNTGEMAFSRDGLRLFAARQEWRFGMWDVDTGSRIQTYETLQPFQRFLPEVGVNTAEDRRVASYAQRGLSRISRIYAPEGSGRLYALLAGTDMGFSASRTYLLEFSAGFSQPDRMIEVEGNTGVMTPAGTRFVTPGSGSEILVYDVPGGRLEHRLSGVAGTISATDVSKDGKRIFIGTNDGTVQTWDADKGELLATSVLLDDGEWLSITPEGFFNASPKAGHLLRLRTGPMRLTTIDQVYQLLFRPDLVQEKLMGDPEGKVREAASRLDLTKLIASGPAPVVRITSPAAGSADKDLVTVEAEAIEQGSGGIGRVEWRVNGVTLGVDAERGLARPDQTGQPASAPLRSVKLTRTLTLEPGENTIEVVAYNAADLIASERAELKITLAATASITPPKLHVLAIGINDYYDGRLKLTYAVPDAKSVASALEKAGNGHYESVEVTTLLDTDVTVEKLDQTFAALSSKVRSKDVLVFFAAGHGKTVDGRYYYLPRDFRYQTEASIAEHGIGQDKWQAWFAGIPARKSILIYDTCESGTLTAAQGQQIAMRSGLEQAAALGRLIQATGRTVLTAATSDRPALEGYQGHGVFTYALLDGMARADRDGNGLIEVTEIAGFIDGAVPEITQRAFGLRQTPQMSIQGSDFSLARRLDGLAGEQTSGGAAPIEPEIPTKPSHVVFEAVKVFGSAGGSGEPVAELKPATTFAVVKTESGWALVARDGKAIGYIEEAKAQKLQ